MIGILIITHAGLGAALLEAGEFITGKKIENSASVSIDINGDPVVSRKKIQDAINSITQNKGVLILTDMFGGTPSNLSYSFLKENETEVMSGVNLPVLVRALDMREKLSLGELAAELETFGKKSILLASRILSGKTDDASKNE